MAGRKIPRADAAQDSRTAPRMPTRKAQQERDGRLSGATMGEERGGDGKGGSAGGKPKVEGRTCSRGGDSQGELPHRLFTLPLRTVFGDFGLAGKSRRWPRSPAPLSMPVARRRSPRSRAMFVKFRGTGRAVLTRFRRQTPTAGKLSADREFNRKSPPGAHRRQKACQESQGDKAGEARAPGHHEPPILHRRDREGRRGPERKTLFSPNRAKD